VSVDFDLVIVGGGPAGAATALFLCSLAPALRGRVAIVDKARFPREKICAGAIGARADKLLEAFDAPIDVPAAAVAGLSVKSGAGALLARLDGRPLIGRVVRRKQFDAALLERARERGATVNEGVAVRGVQVQHERVRLDTDAGELHAHAVIGADGVASRVRRAVVAERGAFHAQAVEVDTPWCDGDPPDDVIHFDVSESGYPGYAWDFPTVVDGRSMVCRGVYQLTRGAPPAASAEPAVDVAERLAARLRSRGLDPAHYRIKRFAERGLSLHQPFARERVLLVGEAAGIDPVLGEGIAQAVLYGHAAARYLAGCVARSDYRFADYRDALRRSRVGLDLRVRSAAVQLVYGRTRPAVEHLVTHSRALAHAGMCYFAGRRVPRLQLALAARDAALAWHAKR
jgi:flavin-dependent dehydrogenase